jgi:uncharacterized protein (DUF433 family)
MFVVQAIQPPPLTVLESGVIRIAETRVTLDTVIGAFLDGETAEQIAQDYPILSLADVYAVINYYLHDKPAVDAYLAEREERREATRREMEARFNPVGIRARLLARRDRKTE